MPPRRSTRLATGRSRGRGHGRGRSVASSSDVSPPVDLPQAQSLTQNLGGEAQPDIQTEAQQAEVDQPIQSEGPYVPDDREAVGLDSVTVHRELLRFLRQNEGSRKPISTELVAAGMTMIDGKTGTDPADAEYWLKKLQRLFVEMEYPSDRKLKATLSLLQGEALYWWEVEEKVIAFERIN